MAADDAEKIESSGLGYKTNDPDQSMDPLQSTQPASCGTATPSETPHVVVHALLEHIFISPSHQYWGKRVDESQPREIQDILQVRCIQDRGLEGDRYFKARPGRIGQVTFFDADVVDEMRERFAVPTLSAFVFRRNLIVRGLRLRDLLGRRFSFQGITFEGAQECKPCVWMDRAVATGAQAYMREAFRGGLRARVCTSGTLCVTRPTD